MSFPMPSFMHLQLLISSRLTIGCIRSFTIICLLTFTLASILAIRSRSLNLTLISIIALFALISAQLGCRTI